MVSAVEETGVTSTFSGRTKIVSARLWMTVGIYYWKRGSDYVKFAEQMIKNNIRVNNEFYVCPVFNQAIAAGLKIKTFNIEKMHGLGTPEDLKFYLQQFN